jgi:hypothetical protein
MSKINKKMKLSTLSLRQALPNGKNISKNPTNLVFPIKSKKIFKYGKIKVAHKCKKS